MQHSPIFLKTFLVLDAQYEEKPLRLARREISGVASTLLALDNGTMQTGNNFSEKSVDLLIVGTATCKMHTGQN